MNTDLLKALLALDSYNRGYSAGIDFTVYGKNGTVIEDNDAQGVQIGTATVFAHSSNTSTGDAFKAGFYGIAYSLPTGEKIISYRGTDKFVNLHLPWEDNDSGGDIWNGWAGGFGVSETNQSDLALQFYQAVAGTTGSALNTANISLTGHSLGGELAGYVASIYH